MNNLKFLNHASYLLESAKSILLFDPWYEKGAFNNGWQLYYQEIKNEEVVKFLKNSGKEIYIWISHEKLDSSIQKITRMSHVGRNHQNES